MYKILDGFPDSYNYLILSELSLSTPKPPLAKIIKIIKEVVGRLESEPSQYQTDHIIVCPHFICKKMVPLFGSMHLLAAFNL